MGGDEPKTREGDELRARGLWIPEDNLRQDYVFVDGLRLLPLVQLIPGVLVGLPAHRFLIFTFTKLAVQARIQHIQTVWIRILRLRIPFKDGKEMIFEDVFTDFFTI